MVVQNITHLQSIIHFITFESLYHLDFQKSLFPKLGKPTQS